MKNRNQYPFPWMNIRTAQVQPVTSIRLPQENSSIAPVQYFNPASCRILSIKFPRPGKIRIRKVISRSGMRPRYKYSSWKMRRKIHGESEHERNAHQLLDILPTCIEFHEQYAEIWYQLDGQEHRHYPDIYVSCRDFHGFLEVKEEADALKPEVIRRSELMKKLLPAHGYQYRILLAESLAREPRLTNAGLIRSLKQRPTLKEYEDLRQLFNLRPAISWNDVLTGALGPKGRAFVFELYLHGHVVFDIERPMVGDSLIEWVRSPHDLPTLVALT